MIKLNRLHKSAGIGFDLQGVGKINNDLAIYSEVQRKGNIKSNWWKFTVWQKASKRLRKESFNKCGYCELRLGKKAPDVNLPSVDHIRPKGKPEYYHLGYSYFNYILSCKSCNVKYKRGDFEIAGKYGPTPIVSNKVSGGEGIVRLKNFAPDPNDLKISWKSPLRLTNRTYRKLKRIENVEKPFLLHPYFDDPEKYFIYKPEIEGKQKRIKVEPSKRLNDEGIKRATYTIDLLGLNRDELSKHRFEEFKSFLNKVRSVETCNRSYWFKRKKWKELTKEYTGQEVQFAGMFRYFLKNRKLLCRMVESGLESNNH